VFGQGVLDGGGREGGWWADPKRADGPRRPRMVFLSRCRNVTLQGLTVRNSPAWNLHPHYSDDLRFLSLTVLAPADSPNTDGFDPESCADVLVAGVRFSVGDDCVAVKAGKRSMAERFPKPCERVEIAHCLMENGHGGVTVGSEMSGGVRDVTVHHCLMRDTDRGLRIKTRRGRGGAVDGVTLRSVRMERVGAPLTLNGFYFCDADGHSPAVQNRAALPVDAGTPRLGAFTMDGVEATDCATCACCALGLPESRIGSLTISDAHFAFRPGAAPFTPVMADGVAPCAGEGLDLTHVERLTLRNVRLSGLRGEALRLTDVTEVDGRVETE
jgi:polygalacturonase